jgi:hypothetical protein
MQLGVTIPLQKFLKMSKPPYGEPVDLFFCWEIHKVLGLGRSTLIAVNASSRYAVVLIDMKAASWKHIPELVTDGIKQALTCDGYTHSQIETYLAVAGEMEFTKTHGRKPVAGLNRAVDMLYWIEKPLDECQLFQPIISASLNKDLCHAAGFEGGGYGCPLEFFQKDMARLGML